MAFHPDLTDEQRSNLTKLAAYLRTLPAEYPDFAMKLFTTDGEGYGPDEAHVAECGTAACAVGHGPAAGIAPKGGESWMGYSNRAFVSYDYTKVAWDWCFHSNWSDADNTAHGAAARIEYMLVHGVPDDSRSQMLCCAPLSYSVEAA